MTQEEKIKQYKKMVSMYKKCVRGGKSVNCDKCIGCAAKKGV